MRVNRCTASRITRCYGNAASSGSVVQNDPLNGIDPLGLRREELEKEIVRTGSRIPQKYSVTVETDLGADELQNIASELPDNFYIANNGKDFGAFDSGEPGYIDSGGTVQNGPGYENERGRVRIGAQIARGLNTVGEEIDIRSGGYQKPLVYDPWTTRYGYHHPVALVIGKPAVSAGIQQTVMTVYHEQLHYRWGAGRADHQRVYNKVYDDLTPLGFSGHYRCMDPVGVGCRW